MAEGESVVNWSIYIVQLVTLAVLLAFGIAKLQELREKRKVRRFLTQPQERYEPRPTVLLTPPPRPIDRGEFLQARIAYLAHMRDEVVEFTEKDENDELVKRSRKMTRKEMIEAVNLQDEEHVVALLDTWDQVQVKQREKSL